jgi:hypothetical protein
MKKLILTNFKDSDSYNKNLIFSENKKGSLTLRNHKHSRNSNETVYKTNSENRKTTSTFNYPISDSIYFKTLSNFSSFSPIASNRTTKSKFLNLKSQIPKKRNNSPKTVKNNIEIQALQFNKRLRLFMNLDKDKIVNKKYQEIIKKNIEDMYFDYDEKNVIKKKNLFSGNNAGILKNKVLFVKGVMDYMFPILTIQKMHYLDEEKHKKFKEEMERAKSLNQNNIYKKRIYSAKHIVRNCKYKYNGVFSSDFSRKTQLINKEKKNLIGGKKKIMNLHKYDFY